MIFSSNAKLPMLNEKNIELRKYKVKEKWQLPIG
jgi:hypothetical protein